MARASSKGAELRLLCRGGMYLNALFPALQRLKFSPWKGVSLCWVPELCTNKGFGWECGLGELFFFKRGKCSVVPVDSPVGCLTPLATVENPTLTCSG